MDKIRAAKEKHREAKLAADGSGPDEVVDEFERKMLALKELVDMAAEGGRRRRRRRRRTHKRRSHRRQTRKHM
jgi:hypothetical protein